jgi:patatin-like phospholipase/acyl hydrolase
VSAAPVRILSVDGGGLRGLVPAMVLRELERRIHALDGSQRPLADYFDLLAGTSTGGLIALGLSAPAPGMNTDELVALYLEDAPKIFPPRLRLLRKIRSFFAPKFSNHALSEVVAARIGDAGLDDARREFLVTCYDMTAHAPRFFKRRAEQGVTMHDAAMATAAAPTYLPPWEVGGHALVDGGVFAANPTVAAIAEALKGTATKPHDLFVVSLGTGFHEVAYRPRPLRTWGALAWIWPRGSEPALLRAMLDGQTASADHWAHMLLNHEPGKPLPGEAPIGHGPRYYRIESALATDVEMDDSRAKTLETLKQVATDLIAEHDADLDAIARRLSGQARGAS